MLKFFPLLLLSLFLNALEIEINSDDFHKVSQLLSEEENIQKLVLQKRIPYEQLNSLSTQNYDNNTERSSVQKEYAKLKMLLVYLSKYTPKSELKERLRRAFFKQFTQKKEEFSFVYKISYPNSANVKGDDVFEALQKKISLYILSEYGVSNIEDSAVIRGMDLKTLTKNYIVGTIESNFINNLDNVYHYEQDKTTRSGVVSFIFYPFVMVKQNQKEHQKSFISSREDIEIDFEEIKKEDGFATIKFSLESEDKEKIKNFITNYTKSYELDVSSSINQISSKILKYKKVANALFEKYPSCHTIGCLDATIARKLESFSTIKKSKLYSYDIDLSNDDDLEYVVLPAFRKLSKYLRRDTQMYSFEDTEVLADNDFSKTTKESKFVAIVKKVSVTPYIKGRDTIGLHFEMEVSFEESDLCSQYYVGISQDSLYGMEFVKLKTENEEIIEVARTELTNEIFNKILPKAKKEQQCQKSFGGTKPANCIEYGTLDKFLAKLNKKSQKYMYRFLTCKEALFFATCGDKQKYCWGNRDNFKKYEFLREDKNDLTLKSVAKREANFLKLYDFCGNILEYCTDKRGWYKTFGSSVKHLQARVFRNSYSDVSGIRLVRERR